MFCAEDLDRSDIAKYFPSNSEYYKSITTLDIWYTKHDGLPKYTDQKVNFYNKYSENLYCADVSVVETIKLRLMVKRLELTSDTSSGYTELMESLK